MYPIIHKRTPQLLPDKRVLDKRVFVFLGIVILFVAVVFWQKELLILGERVGDFLVSRKQALLSGISFHLEEPLDLEEGAIEITLPTIIEEPISEEEVLAEEPLAGEEPFLEGQEMVFRPREEKRELTLSEIEEQITGITAKAEVISQEVAELLEASGKEPIVEEELPVELVEETEKEAQLAEIQEQINEISAKVKIISQEVAKLVKA